MVSFLNKIVNLMKLSMLIILFFPSLHSSPPAEAIRSSSKQISGHNGHFCYKKSQQFKNRANCLSNFDPSHVIHIAMTLDHQFFRGTVAAIHSILQHSSCPENIFFHFVFSDSGNLQLIIRDIFPSLKFKSYYFNPEIVRDRISPTVREALEQPLNYARNYLADLLGHFVERVIYIDSDVILVDDILKLWTTSLSSRTLASPEYCHVNFTKYFTSKFWSNKTFSKVFNGRKPCYFNTGQPSFFIHIVPVPLLVHETRHLPTILYATLWINKKYFRII